MGYIRIKHKIVEEHFEPPMATAVAPITETTDTTSVQVEPVPAAPEYCSTASMSVQTAETVIESLEPIPSLATSTIQDHSLKLWSAFNDVNQKIIDAAINNPAGVENVRDTAVSTIEEIGNYVKPYVGVSAGLAVAAGLDAVEGAVVNGIKIIAADQDVTLAKEIVNQKIIAFAELLDSVDTIHWPKATLIGALDQYVMLNLQLLLASKNKNLELITPLSESIKELIKTISAVFASGLEGKTPRNF